MGDLAALAEHLAGAARKLEEEASHEAFSKAGEILVAEIRSAIGTYKYGWPSLAAATLARKAGDTPLLETGAYQASFHTVLGHAEAWVGTADPKATWFENGTSRMPPRPVLQPALWAKESEVIEPFLGLLRTAILK